MGDLNNIKHIADFIKFNNTLKRLDLSNNRITTNSFEMIYESLMVNKSLEFFTLKNNKIKFANIKNNEKIQKLFKDNQTLKEFIL